MHTCTPHLVNLYTCSCMPLVCKVTVHEQTSIHPFFEILSGQEREREKFLQALASNDTNASRGCITAYE